MTGPTPHPPEAEDADHLGDGAYIGHNGYTLMLWTSNGIMHTRPVYLDPAAVLAMKRYLKRRGWWELPR